MEEAFQQLNARIAQLENVIQQLQPALQQAQADRTALIQALANNTKSDSIVDTKGVGQPFKYTGKKDTDFAEWVHKFTTFIEAKFSRAHVDALKWAARQRTMIVHSNPTDDPRRISYNDRYGDEADEIDKIE